MINHNDPLAIFVWVEKYRTYSDRYIDEIVEYIAHISGWEVITTYYNVVLVRPVSEDRKQDTMMIKMRFGRNISFYSFKEMSK